MARLNEIIPDIVIDGRFLSMSLDGIGANLIRGTKTLLDVKTLSCKEAYAEERTGVAGAVVTKRQEEVNRQYHMRAREIDLAQGTAPGETGPLKKKLDEYGQSGRVLAPVVGAFAEVSTDTYALVDLISSALADDHCSYYTESPSEAKAVFTQRLYNSFGLSAHLGWARLLIDRYRDLVDTPIS